MSRRGWALARFGVGVVVLVVLVWRLGSGPFLDGIRTVDGRSLVVATLVALGTTVCCAWRWRVVVAGLDGELPMGAAVAAYYRSQFLNTTLPGGVVGDVHRAVHHGRAAGDVRRGARAVVWDRLSGQLVQVLVTVVVLLALPSPVRSSVPAALALGVTGALALVLAGRLLVRRRTATVSRVLTTLVSDMRTAVLTRRAWPVILLASSLAVAGHVVTFVLAARTAGATTSTLELVPLALLVLVAMAVPANVAGWGPREGVAAWVFAASGLGAAQGVTTAVVYGVLVLVASLPGAVVLLLGTRRPARA